MSDLEKIIDFHMSKIQVLLPCEIVKLNGLYADVKPLIDYNNINFPIIPSIPIVQFGNSKTKIKFKSNIGDIVSVFFSQLDLNNYLVGGITGKLTNIEKFNLSNAIAIPFNIHKINEEETAISDFEIIGDLDITGNINMEGNLDIDGNINISGNITVSGGDVVADGISLKGHKHPIAWTDPAGAGMSGGPV